MDLVKDSDFPAGPLRNHVAAGPLWKECERFLGLFIRPPGQDPLSYPSRMTHSDGEPVVYSAAKYYNAAGDRNYALYFLCSSAPQDNADPDDEKPGEMDDNRLLETKLTLHWLWAAYLTRTKLGMTRARCFGWRPGHNTDQTYTVENMSYRHISSWQRVNKYARSNLLLKGYLERDAGIVQAGQQMDLILQQFSAMTGVPLDVPGNSVDGNRFPVSSSFWVGKLPAWHKLDNEETGFDLDTRALSKEFRDQASYLRQATGAVFEFFGAYVQHLDGTPLPVDSPPGE